MRLEVLRHVKGAENWATMEQRLLDLLPKCSEPADLWARAADLQRTMTGAGFHAIPLPNFLMAVVAVHANLVMLHYDRDYQDIADHGGINLRHNWVARPGSL